MLKHKIKHKWRMGAIDTSEESYDFVNDNDDDNDVWLDNNVGSLGRIIIVQRSWDCEYYELMIYDISTGLSALSWAWVVDVCSRIVSVWCWIWLINWKIFWIKHNRLDQRVWFVRQEHWRSCQGDKTLKACAHAMNVRILIKINLLPFPRKTACA